MTEKQEILFKKVDDKTQDPKHAQESEKADQTSDVEGQYMYWRYGTCPYCGQGLRVRASSDVYIWYRCANCGGSFKA